MTHEINSSNVHSMNHISKSFKTTGLALISGLMLAGSAQAAVVLRDTFTTDEGGTVGGRTLDTPQAGSAATWGTPDNNTSTTGGKLQLGSNSGFAKASAPFNGNSFLNQFTVSYDWSLVDGINPTQFYGGLGNSMGDGQNHVDFGLSMGFVISGDFNSTSVTANWGTTTDGNRNTINDGSSSITRDSVNDDWAASLSFSYDPADSTAEFYIDGVSQGTASRTYFAEGLGGLWFKGQTNTSFELDNLQVTVAAPEPSSLGLILLGGAMLRGVRKSQLNARK